MDSESRGSALVVSASVSTHVNIQPNKKPRAQHVISAAALFSGCANSSRLNPQPSAGLASSPVPAATVSAASHIAHLLISVFVSSSFVSPWLRWTQIRRINPHARAIKPPAQSIKRVIAALSISFLSQAFPSFPSHLLFLLLFFLFSRCEGAFEWQVEVAKAINRW